MNRLLILPACAAAFVLLSSCLYAEVQPNSKKTKESVPTSDWVQDQKSQAKPAFDADSMAKSRAVAIKSTLPKGWSLKVEQDTVIIRRDKKVGIVHNSRVAPMPIKREWFPSIRVRVGPSVSMMQYVRMALANEVALKKTRALRPHYSPVNYRPKLPHSLPTHHDAQSSLWISGGHLDGGRIEFESKEVARECTGVYDAIKGLSVPYPPVSSLWGPPVHGLRVGLDVVSPVADDGKIRLRFRMCNIGDKPVRVLRLSAQKRAWGEHLPLLVKVKRDRFRVARYRGPEPTASPIPASADYVQLKPGEIDSIEVVMNPVHWGAKDVSKVVAAFVFTNARGKVALAPGELADAGIWTGTVHSPLFRLAEEPSASTNAATVPTSSNARTRGRIAGEARGRP